MAHSKALYVKNEAKIKYLLADLDRTTIPFLEDQLQINPKKSITTLQIGQPLVMCSVTRNSHDWWHHTSRQLLPKKWPPQYKHFGTTRTQLAEIE